VEKKYLTVITVRCLLFTTLIIGLIQTQASAQEAKEVELEKIIVTNRRAQVLLSEASENVVVIDEDEIKQLPARDLSEVLNYLPGVYIEPRQGFGRATNISIQGADSRQVRIMIDGIPLNTQASGQVNPAKFPIEDISRIEVIKGAASSLWGSSLGGVINVITKDTGTTLIPKGSLTTSFAGFRTRKESGEISGKAGGLGYYLFSSYMQSGGKGPRDDVLEKKGFGKLSYDLKEMGKINGSFGFSQADVHSGELPDGTWEAHPYRCQYGKVGWSKSFESMDLNVDLKNSRQDIIEKDYDTVDTVVPWRIIRYKDVLYQMSIVSAMHPRDKDLFIVGMDSDWSILESTYLTEAKDLRLQAPYANYTLKLKPWDLNLGLRYDHNSEFGQQVSPSVGCIYHLGSIADTLIRVNISRAFNAPPLLWKYYDEDLSGLITNPGLKPERAWVYELGLESQPLPEFWLKFSLYRQDVSDAISAAKNEADQTYMKNFEKFRRQGIEAQIKWEFLKGLSFFGAGAFNDVKDRATRQTVQDAGSPRQSFDLGFEYQHKKGFSLYLNGRYDYWNKTFDIFEPKDRKFVFDFKATQKFKHLSCFLNIYNFTNTKYWADYYYPIPERYFEGGFTIEW
jgi:vitamin B12 transporter